VNDVKSHVSDKALKVVLFMAFMLLIGEISPILARIFTGELYAYAGTIAFYGTFILMYLVTDFFARSEGSSIGKLGIDFDETTLPQITIGAIAGTIAASVVVLFAFYFGGQLRPIQEMTADLLMSEIIITVPTAVFEELAHRGYILPHIEELTGKTNAILIGSLFFSMLHFSWWTTPGLSLYLIPIFSFNIFLGGVVLSFSYYWSGRKLWVPISFHFAWNMIAYIVFPNFPRVAVFLPEIFQIEWGFTTIIGFLIGFCVVYGLLKRKNRE
jgi:membrane protease YdiL (CAAX protease family)